MKGISAKRAVLASIVIPVALLIHRLKLLRPATIRAFREAGGWRSVLDFSFPASFVYGRWTAWLGRFMVKYVYPRINKSGPEGRTAFAEAQHAKMLLKDHAGAII